MHELLHTFVRIHGRDIAAHLWSSTLLLLLLGVSAIALRSWSAKLRHTLWLLGLCKFLVYAPMISAVLLALHIDLVRIFPSTHPSARRETGAAFVVSGAGVPLKTGVWDQVRAEWPCAAAAVWMAGTLCALFVLIGRFGAVHLLRSKTLPASAELQRAIDDAAQQAKLRPVPVFMSYVADTLAVVGARNPVIVVSRDLSEQLSSDELQSLLLHELAHVRRRDNFTRGVGALSRALFWFHPLVLWSDRRLAVERERACDEMVVELQAKTSQYAALLSSVARIVSGHLQPAGVSCLHHSDLIERMKTLMTHHSPERPLLRHLVVAAAALLLFGASGWSTLLYAQQNQNPTPEASRVAPAAQHRTYTGEPIDLNVKDAQLNDVLNTFSLLTGLQISVDPAIQPKLVTMNVHDEPWDQVLEEVLEQQNLVYVLEGNSMRILNGKSPSRLYDLVFRVTPAGDQNVVIDLDVKDHQSGRILSSPHLTAQYDKHVVVTPENDGHKLAVQFWVDKVRGTLSYDLTVMNGNRFIYSEHDGMALKEIE